MPLWPEFCGGSYQALSPVIAADQAINIFLETRELPGSAKQATFYGTPGLKPWLELASRSCRGWYHQDGRTFVVVGGTLYELDLTLVTATAIGTIPDDGHPVTYASNGQGGTQIGIVGGGELKVFDTSTNTLSAAIALPFTGPVMITFLDGYGLINQADSPIFWFSALEDFTTWDALDFVTRSATSDNLVGLAVMRDRIWAFGSQTTTLFYDSGDVDTPFVPYPGTTMQIGLVSPSLLTGDADTLAWVAETPHGTRQLVSASDASPTPISTPPIDQWLAACATLEDAELTQYRQNEHVFLILTAPSSPDDVQTYALDVRESQWHARAGWNSTTGRYTRWRVRGLIAINGTVYAGDYDDGNLYTLDLATYDDNGAVLKRERTAPYLASENQWLFLDQVELGIQAGVGLSSGQGSDPKVQLEISRDGGRTWVSAGLASLGAIGAYTARAIWRRLGRVRSDRLVLRVTQTDPVQCVWGPGAWLRTTNGSGQL